MRRLALLVAVVPLLFAPAPSAAQSDNPRVYMMYFKVDIPDIPKWIENYQQHERPVLDSLVANGTLLAYDFWGHDTGGEYNLRYNFVVANWDGIDDFMNAYYGAVGPDIVQEWLSMVRDHMDEIWVVSDSDIPDGGSSGPVIYESSFQIDYGRQAQWEADFKEYGRPALERAMEEGLIRAWAELHHDTGGPWNVKYVYWLNSWDAADDAMARMGEIRAEQGQDMKSAQLIRRHADNVWRSVPRSNR